MRAGSMKDIRLPMDEELIMCLDEMKEDMRNEFEKSIGKSISRNETIRRVIRRYYPLWKRKHSTE
jgi:hypothetical protein